MPSETRDAARRKDENDAWDKRMLAEISPQVAASVERVSRDFKKAYELRLEKERSRNRQKVLDAQE
jgi:hypothetical protein